MRNLISTIAIAALFALLPVSAKADCSPYNICLGGDASSLGLSDNGHYYVSGTGEWEMVTRGLEYEYVSHFYLYNDSASTRYVDKVGFHFTPSDISSGSSGVCNWNVNGLSPYFTNCHIYVCLSDSYQSFCQQHDVDGVPLTTAPWANRIRFDGFYGLQLEAGQTLAIDIVYEPQGSGAISPGVTSTTEQIELIFQ